MLLPVDATSLRLDTVVDSFSKETDDIFSLSKTDDLFLQVAREIFSGAKLFSRLVTEDEFESPDTSCIILHHNLGDAATLGDH